MWYFFPVLLWFYSEIGNNAMVMETRTGSCVEGKRVKKKGWKKRESVLVAAPEADAGSAPAFNLPQPFSAISKSGANQKTCLHVWTSQPSWAAFSFFFSPPDWVLVHLFPGFVWMLHCKCELQDIGHYVVFLLDGYSGGGGWGGEWGKNTIIMMAE